MPRIETHFQRTNAGGLTVTVTNSHDNGRFSTTERTEAFVVRFRRNTRLESGRQVAAGTTAFIWRSYHPFSDYDAPKPGDVSYNGFLEGGRQSIGWNSDGAAALVLETVRVNGQIMKAADHPRYEASAEAYRCMMSY